jgi:hypothetical protein
VPVNEASEILALMLIFVVHVAGGLMLVWGMLDGESRPGWYPRRRRGDDGPGDDPPPPAPSSPPAGRARAPRPLPLGDTAPSDVRLRDERRLRDAHPRPPRRPQHDPPPERAPERR